MSDAQVPGTIDQDGEQVPTELPPLKERANVGHRKKKLAQGPSLRREMIAVYRAYCIGTISESEYKTLMGGLKIIRDGIFEEEKLELAKGEGGGTMPFTGITLIGPAIEEPADDGA